MGSLEKNLKTKSRKANPKLPRRVSEMSKEALEATLRKKSECNAKALQIVEQLLENNVSEDWFLNCLKFISENHYQDIIEERAITMNCGYPLCTKKLRNIPTQQYHISTKLNKVYDITERKNFCSNLCYKASTYLKQQLLTSPLWMRDKEVIPKFLLLPVHSSSGSVGDEVDIGQRNPLKEDLKQIKQEKSDDFTSISQFMKDSLSMLSSDFDSEEKKTKNKERRKENKRKEHSDLNLKKSEETSKPSEEIQKSHKMNDSKETIESKDSVKSESTCNMANPSILSDVQNVNSNDIEVIKENNSCSSSDKPELIAKDVVSLQVEQFNETMTEMSKQFGEKLVIDKQVTEPNNSKPSVTHIETKDTTRKHDPNEASSENRRKSKSKKSKESKKQSLDIPPMTSAVIHIEKCLHEWFTIDSMCYLFGEEKVKEMVSEKGECIKEYYKAVHKTSWDPKLQEQYMAICRRLNIMELEENQLDENSEVATKPLPDYTIVKEEGKKMDLKVRAFFQGKTTYEDTTSSTINTDKDTEVSVLPLVDLHAQNAWRRRIVLDRFNRVLPDLLRTFDLSSRDVSGDVRNLVTTFTLGSHNITFRPSEWSLLGLIIIKMLAIKDTRLRILLDSEQVAKYTTMMLMGFQQDGGYLDRLIAWLTDLDNLLHKQKT